MGSASWFGGSREAEAFLRPKTGASFSALGVGRLPKRLLGKSYGPMVKDNRSPAYGPVSIIRWSNPDFVCRIVAVLMLSRRELFWMMVGASLKGTRSVQAQFSADFLKPIGKGRTFASISDGRAAKPGDVIWARDLTQMAPPGIWSEKQTRGKWHARPYRLADGQSGKLLMVNDTAKSEGPKAVPPEFEVKLDLPGWYSIWIGVPKMDLRPRVICSDGVDVALDGEKGFVQIGVERGVRKGRMMGPMNVEVMCFWKCTKLEGRTLRVRVPYGTFVSFPWGLVRGSLCGLRLVRLSEEQVASYQKEIFDPATKRVIVVNDGFSHYFTASEPGKELTPGMSKRTATVM